MRMITFDGFIIGGLGVDVYRMVAEKYNWIEGNL